MEPKKSQQKTEAKQDSALIRQALAHQEEAFIQLYRKSVGALYGFVYSKVNQQQDAEDIVSETFYQALKDLAKYSYKSSFKNWLYGIAKHLILAYYRAKYNKGTVELDENDFQGSIGSIGSTAHEASSSTLLPDEMQEDSPQTNAKTSMLETIFEDLPRNYRSVLELRFLRGYSIIETAKALGITEQNAKVIQHRAIKKANVVAKKKNILLEEPMV